MKILRVITRLNIGGPSHQAQLLHLRLRKMGHDCTLVHGLVGPDEGDHRFLGGEGVVIYSELTRPISPIKDWACLRKLCRLLGSEPFDILHTHTAKAGLLARVAAWSVKERRRKKGFPELKVVHTYHGHVFKGYFRPLMTRVVLGLERWLARHTDHLITLSPRLAEEISSYLNVPEERLDIVHLGLDLEAFLNSRQERLDLNRKFSTTKTCWVGWVGRLVPIKNPADFLRLAVHVSGLCPEVGFVMVGDGPLRSEIEQEIDDLDLKGSVFLTGWEENMPLWMSALDALINTSFNEGTPVALLEAMAAGTPVLASDVGGCQDILPSGEPVSVYPTGSIVEQTDQVRSWLDSKARISESTRKAICTFYSVDRLARDLLKLYQQGPSG